MTVLALNDSWNTYRGRIFADGYANWVILKVPYFLVRNFDEKK